MLEHQGITGTEGRAGKRGSHLGTAENPTPNGQPQGCDKDAPTGRMARSLTQREDWTRDLGGCLTAPVASQFLPVALVAGQPKVDQGPRIPAEAPGQMRNSGQATQAK